MSRPSAYALAFMNISTIAEAAKNLGSNHVDHEPALYTKRLNEWHDKGKQLATQGNSSVWKTADWLLEATGFNSREGWCYKEAAAILSWSVGTCRNYACVAKAFPPERRVTSEVTFAHYRVVAALPEPEQERLLQVASANRWTVGRLRGEVRKVNGSPRKQVSFTHLEKWWMAIQRMTSTGRMTDVLSGMERLVQPPKRQEAAACLREMGARFIALAEQIETLPPTTEPQVREEEMVTA